MKQIIYTLLLLSTIIVIAQPCSGITGTGILKSKGYTSCYDTVKTTSYLNTVIADTVTVTRINGITVTNGGAGALTVTGTTAISGTNTGDQTTISGNAATATALQTSRNINGTAFNGTTDVTVTAAAGTLTGATLASGVTASSLTSVGTLASPTLATPTLTGTTTISGNVTAPAWIGNGIGLIQNAATYTDNSSSGAVGVVVIDKINAPTLAASSSTTPSAIATLRIAAPLRGTNIAGAGTLYSLITDGETWNTGGLLVGAQLTVTTNLTVSGSVRFGYVAKTGTYTITTTDNTIECTSGTFTTTLPTAVGVTGRYYIIKNTGGGTITVATTSSQTIDGASTLTILTNKCYTVQSNGANWIITAVY